MDQGNPSTKNMKQENAISQEKYQVRLVVASLIFTF